MFIKEVIKWPINIAILLDRARGGWVLVHHRAQAANNDATCPNSRSRNSADIIETRISLNGDI